MEYLKSNAVATVEASDEERFELPKDSKDRVFYACEIGARSLFFELGDRRSPYHPFVLVDLGQMAP